MLAVGRILVVVVWIAAAAAFALPETQPWARTGRVVFVAMLGIHALEALVFLPRLRAAGGSLGAHVVRTLLFGFLHVGRLPRA